MPRSRLVLEWLVVTLVAAALAVAAAFAATGMQLSSFLFDEELGWTQRGGDPRILIVQIDEQSLKEVGHWPWPRHVHAALIERLSEGGVAGIGYDVLFAEPADTADDLALAQAMDRSRRVAIPAYVQVPGQNGRAYDLELPIEPIAKAARSIGHVNVLFDADGQVRRARLQDARQSQPMPHLMQVLARDVSGAKPDLPAEMIIPFNAAGAYASVPARAILKGEVPKALLKERIVLVGATAQGLGDLLPVSGAGGSVMPGVEVQANILDAILNRSWIRDGGPEFGATSAVAGVLLVMLLFWRLPPSKGLLAGSALALAGVACSTLTLQLTGYWVSPVPLLIGLASSYPLWSWRRLSALNSFVETQARVLESGLGDKADAARSRGGLDSIAAAASRLRGVIGELQDRESFLRDTIESAPDALCIVDHEGIALMLNRPAAEIFGEASLGQRFQELLERYDSNGTLGDNEITLPDGRTMLVKIAPFSGSAVEHGATIVRLADITDRRDAERERDNALEFLSHDMRAPQASILTTLERASVPGDVQPVIDRVREYAARSLKLADDFVQLARLKKVAPRADLIDLAGVFQEAIDGLYDKAAARGVVIDLTVPQDLPPICGDSWMLVRAVGNLLDNAVKYGPEHGVVACEIEVAVRVANGGARIVGRIADKGPGIPAPRMEALFERFGPNNPGAGLSAGLGLAFVKQAVELHNGTMECTSSDTGTQFSLTFDASTDQMD